MITLSPTVADNIAVATLAAVKRYIATPEGAKHLEEKISERKVSKNEERNYSKRIGG